MYSKNDWNEFVDDVLKIATISYKELWEEVNYECDNNPADAFDQGASITLRKIREKIESLKA